MVATGAGAKGTPIGAVSTRDAFPALGHSGGSTASLQRLRGMRCSGPQLGGSPAQGARVTEEGDWWGRCEVSPTPTEARPGAALPKRLSEACETALLSARGRRPGAAPPGCFQSSPVALRGCGLRYPCQKTAGLKRELRSCARGRGKPGSAGVPC